MSKLFDYALSQVSDEVKYFVDNSIEITNQIHSILEKQEKTQKDLADLLGKNESEISKWLSGTHNFTLKSISKIEAVLKEKIITTPLQSEQSFLKMAENAVQFLDVKYSSYFPIVTLPEITSTFVEVNQPVSKVEEVPPVASENSYAMAA